MLIENGDIGFCRFVFNFSYKSNFLLSYGYEFVHSEENVLCVSAVSAYNY